MLRLGDVLGGGASSSSSRNKADKKTKDWKSSKSKSKSKLMAPTTTCRRRSSSEKKMAADVDGGENSGTATDGTSTSMGNAETTDGMPLQHHPHGHVSPEQIEPTRRCLGAHSNSSTKHPGPDPPKSDNRPVRHGSTSTTAPSGPHYHHRHAHTGRGKLDASDRTDRTSKTAPLHGDDSSKSTQTYPQSLSRSKTTSATALCKKRHRQVRSKNGVVMPQQGGSGHLVSMERAAPPPSAAYFASSWASQQQAVPDDVNDGEDDDEPPVGRIDCSTSALASADDSFFVKKKKTKDTTAAMEALEKARESGHGAGGADPPPPVYMNVPPSPASLSPMSSFGPIQDPEEQEGAAIPKADSVVETEVDLTNVEKEQRVFPAGTSPVHNHVYVQPQRRSIDLEQLETGDKITAKCSEVGDIDKPRHTIGCTPHECHGAMMDKSGFSAVDNSYSQPIDVKVAEAVAFIRQFAEETSHLTTPQDLQDRIDDVTNDIQGYGTYRHTHEELEFGCRLAWRNSGRCIMRKVSFNLELRDCRNAKTSRECFEQIIEHLRYAGNGGAIKPVISVFPQKGDGVSASVRVWNRQLIGYSAYQRKDGSVMGDPVNLSFTALCVKLGWTPPSTKSDFDVLPLIISDNIVGHDKPRVFEIPADAILEVPIHHPEHELFSSLNLRWYALPAISNMGVDIGGVYYQTAPFNGWYQVTEIGRDFLDKQRYDLAEAVAVACGIQRSKIGVWRDKVQCHIHEAILHSFAKASVSLVDHHTASDAFVDFHREEISKRGKCPADWVWLTPPAGGSMTKVFHQEMVNFIIKPIYRPNVDICLEAGLNNMDAIVLDEECTSKSSFTFDTKAMIYDKIVLCFGSETGTSQRFITRLATDLHVLGDRVVGPIPLDDLPNHFPTPRCKDRTLILAAVSTTGIGSAPSHAKLFLPRIENMMQQSGTMNTTSFAVLSLGNSAYTQSFAKFGFDVHLALESIGIMPVLNVRIADELMDQELSFDEWRGDILNDSSGIIYQEDIDAYALATTKSSAKDAKRKVTLSYQGFAQVIQNDTKHELEKLYRQAEHTPWSRVQGLLGRSTDLFCFEVNPAQSHQLDHLRPGDHVALYPENLDDSVDFTLRNVDGLDEGMGSARDVLKKKVDLARPVSTAALARLWDKTRNGRAKYVISSIMRISTKDETDKSVVDLINELPPGSVPYKWIVNSAPAMDPRFYSIASMSREERTISICQSVYTFANGQAGTTSRWLRSLQADQKATAVFSQTDLHLPTDEDAPCIMIATGTGIAPFRSFWMSNARNPMHLFFGCRTRSDLPFASEIDSLERAGRINPYIAYSREMSNKMHVHDMLARESEAVLSLLHNPKTCLYICGSPDMAATVQNRLLMVLCNGSHSQSGMKMNQAMEKLVVMKQQKRFITEVYGTISSGDDAMQFAWKEATARVVEITSGLERLVLPTARAKEEFKAIRPTKRSSWADEYRPENSGLASNAQEEMPLYGQRNSDDGMHSARQMKPQRSSSLNTTGLPRTESLASIPEAGGPQRNNSLPGGTQAHISSSVPSSPFVPTRPRLHRRESWMGSFAFGTENSADPRMIQRASRRASDGGMNIENICDRSNSNGTRRASIANAPQQRGAHTADQGTIPRRASTLGMSNPNNGNRPPKAERRASGGAA